MFFFAILFIYILTGYNRDHCDREGDRAPVTFYAIYYQSDYAFTGSVQTFTAPVSGWYQIECWGAQGGDEWGTGGLGGYSRGELYIPKGTSVYVYVGGQGITVGGPGSPAAYGGGGWNGGGHTYGDNGWGSGAGGGATDVRTVNAAWNNMYGLQNRFIVAGGGGGAGAADNFFCGCMSTRSCHGGGHGGGLMGGSSRPSGMKGGTQTSAGPYGGFGYGGSTAALSDCGGGGGGWYGGGTQYYNKPVGGLGDVSGGGGSSYISGYPGCAASPTGYVLRNGHMEQGTNSGHGRARFILVSQ